MAWLLSYVARGGHLDGAGGHSTEILYCYIGEHITKTLHRVIGDALLRNCAVMGDTLLKHCTFMGDTLLKYCAFIGDTLLNIALNGGHSTKALHLYGEHSTKT